MHAFLKHFIRSFAKKLLSIKILLIYFKTGDKRIIKVVLHLARFPAEFVMDLQNTYVFYWEKYIYIYTVNDETLKERKVLCFSIFLVFAFPIIFF